MGFHHDAAALRRSAEKARWQMDSSWDEDTRARFETIAIELDREAAVLEAGLMRDAKARVSI